MAEILVKVSPQKHPQKIVILAPEGQLRGFLGARLGARLGPPP